MQGVPQHATLALYFLVMISRSPRCTIGVSGSLPGARRGNQEARAWRWRYGGGGDRTGVVQATALRQHREVSATVVVTVSIQCIALR